MPRMILRATRILLAVGVLFVAVLAFAASAATVPNAGIGGFSDGETRVSSVEPGSPAWRMGIRARQIVLESRASDQPGGGLLRTTDGTTESAWSDVGSLASLRNYVAWSVVAVVLALLAALPAVRGHAAAAPVLPIAYAVAAQPLFFAGNFVATLFGGLAIFVAGALAVVAFSPWRWWLAVVLVAGTALGIAWVAAMLVEPAWFDALDATRLPAAGTFSLAGLLAVVDVGRVRSFVARPWSLSYIDIAYLGAGAAFIVAAGFLGRAPIELLVVAAVVGLGVYPIWRANAIGAFERFVTSRARRDAAILAIEEERGRLARDIHDAPLQDLSGVIRRLEAVPGAEQEATALRDVAARLRDVATSLRPPVLEDLGLASAILDLQDQLASGRPEWIVEIDVDDATAMRRPPPDVELAALRVIQEAAGNAVAHSGGRRLSIRGRVSSDAIELTAADDGHGFGLDDARDARRAGHFGLDSIRERAEAVGAAALVSSTSGGTLVTFRWERAT